MMTTMNTNYGQRLLEGESQALKFKASLKTTVESLAAFGTALAGVSDAGVLHIAKEMYQYG